MGELDVSASKLSESAQRVVDRAIEEARRRRQPLTNPHIFVAFAEVEAGLFDVWMREVGVDPDDIEHAIRQHLDTVASDPHAELRVSPPTKLLFKLASHHAVRRGRSYLGSIDLFIALFEEPLGHAVALLRQRGAEPETVIGRGLAAMRTFEAREEQLEQDRRAALAADWQRYHPDGYRSRSESEVDALVEEVEPRSLRQRFFDLLGMRRRTRS